MDLASFTNLNNETASQCIKEAAKEAMLTMWGGQQSSLKEDAAELFGNTFAQMFSETFIPQLSENIVNLIESACISGTVSVKPAGTPNCVTSLDTNGGLMSFDLKMTETPGSQGAPINEFKVKCL